LLANNLILLNVTPVRRYSGIATQWFREEGVLAAAMEKHTITLYTNGMV